MEKKKPNDCSSQPGASYEQAGVNIAKEEKALKIFIQSIQQSLSFIKEGPGQALSSIGYFANILKITDTLGLAVSADGVGTKVLIAQMMNKYDTVGIDCIAMNVNDLLCVGAKPISFLDYIALQDPHEDLMEQLGKGLLEGARQAGVTIPGGETAQVRDLIQGVRPGYGFDLAGMAIGIVEPAKVIEGQDLAEGDVILGVASNGLHSNGYSLARRVLFDQGHLSVDTYRPELAKTIGEELLTPTIIYVQMVNDLLSRNLQIKGLINITGDGLLNLLRVKTSATFTIDHLPETPPIFSLIQGLGNISDEEMYKVFNMGIGFCLLLPAEEVDSVRAVCSQYHLSTFPLGRISPSPERVVKIPAKKLKGLGRTFYHE